ncbi:MAG TPA: hypothetical protein DEA46_04130 [Candidatus Moranbacteria bacterium]|nr:hypothetical protein [Candidatus Moranbacteria bacterium]
MKEIKLIIILVSLIFYLGVSAKNVFAADFYISPTGNDSNNGQTSSTPVATFAHAETLLNAGDTLILMDGIYNQQLHPRKSGTEGNPITYMAQNRGQAIIQMTTPGEAILLASNSSGYPGGAFYCHDITIDGLIARSNGEYNTIVINSWDSATEAEMVKRIIIRNIGAFGSALDANAAAVAIGNNATYITIEDSFAYGIGRAAMIAFGSSHITVRRVVLRYDYWRGTGKINDPRRAFSGYNTQDSVFENIIVLDGAPMPPEVSCDMAGMVASGNLTPAYVTHSARNKYLGSIVLNTVGNGLLTNGGGSPNEDQQFKDLIFHKVTGYGAVVEQLETRGIYEYITIKNSGALGFKTGTNGVSDETIKNFFIDTTGGVGFYLENPSAVTTFVDNTAINLVSGSPIEASYAPTLDYLTRPTMVTGHERGGTMVNRYVDGNLTSIPLWPWPNEDLIRENMCDPDDLITAHRTSANGAGWEPEWCASNKTLTEHIWEYLGNECPEEICGAISIRSDVDNSSATNTTDALLTLRNSLGLSMDGTAWQVGATTGDVDCSGASNSTDALLILRYSLGLSMDGTSWCE